MIATSEGLWQDWDDTVEDAHEEPTVGRRRLLLGGVVSGLALAATGLFLPAWLAETEARQGALGGTSGGRHGKNHRGRHKQRSHRDKKDKHNGRDDAPRGGAPFRSSALTVVNKGVQPLQCTFFFRVKTGLDDYALPTADGTQTIAANGTFRYDPDRYRVGVLIKQILPADIYADVRNVSFFYPRGGVTQGSNLDPASGNFGSALIPEQNFSQGEAQQDQNVVLQRLKDDSKGAQRIEWELIIR
jgi:hypothetical protein